MRTHGEREVLADDIMPVAGSRHGVNQAADILMPDFTFQFASQIILNANWGCMFNCLHRAYPDPKDGLWQAAFLRWDPALRQYPFSVAQTSKPAGRNDAGPIWKSAAQQVWKPALHKLSTTLARL
jgi:hypothetical protein